MPLLLRRHHALTHLSSRRITWSFTGTGSFGSFGLRSSGRVGRSESFLAALPLDVGGRLDERDTLDATELERARRGVDRRGVVARLGVELAAGAMVNYCRVVFGE